MPEPILAVAPLSPCISQCALDERGYCRGCLRSVDEITRWTRLTPDEQWAVIHALKARRLERALPA